MILLYNLLEENRERIVVALLNKIPREVRAYSRVPRSELRDSIEHLYDAYLDLLVSGDNANLKVIFKYVTRVRVAQSFPLASILRAFLFFTPVTRLLLQEEFRRLGNDGPNLFNRAMNQIERTTYESIATFTEVFQQYVQSRIDEHNDYLHEQTEQPGIDLSRFILFKG